jgi:ligand-binding sensor domain-containing protein
MSAHLAVGQQLFFTNYPLFEKNEQLGVHHMVQDEDGLMWLASGSRLYTFDGLDYKRIQLPDSMVGDISALYYHPSHEGTIWIGTSEGHLLNDSAGQFNLIEFPNAQKHRITGVQVDFSRHVWISTYGGGVFVKAPNNRSYTQLTEVWSRDVYCMMLDEQGGVWAGTDHGIYFCQYDGTGFLVKHYNKKDGLSDEIVKDMCLMEGMIYLGTQEGGLIQFDVAQQQFASLTDDWPHGEINRLTCYQKNEIWIVTERDGVFAFEMTQRKLRIILNQQHVTFSHIEEVIFDREGLVWLASAHNSLNKAVKCFEFYSPGVADIQMIGAKDEDHVYLGTSQGLFTYDLVNDSSSLVQGTSNLNIISFDQIENHLIFGTFDRGLGIMNTTNNRIEMITELNGLPNNSVIAIAHRDNTIWLSTLAGVGQISYVARADAIAIKDIKPFKLLTHDYVYDIEFDDDNSIYFATDGHGVAHYKDDQVLYYNLDSIGNNQIVSLARGRNNSLWAVENSTGLCVVDVLRKNLASDVFAIGSDISAMASDGKNHLLVIHRNGIDVIDEISGELINFGVESGFDDFSPALNAITSVPGGPSFTAGQTKLVRIRPPQSYSNTPEVHINYVKIGDRELTASELDVVLDAEEHTIHFNLSGLFFTNPESVSFRYQLVGHEEDWKETRDQDIIYSKLPPSRYIFQAEAVSNKAIYHGGHISRFEFTILPPIWRRWWFIALAVLSIGLIFYLFIKNREHALMRETELQNAMIERQYEVLKNQLNPHFLFNAFNTLIGYIEEDPKTAVEVVEKLSDFYRKILELKEHKLVHIDQELILLKDYVFLLNKRFGNNLKLSLNLNGYNGLIPPMTLQILVENAVKHNMLSASHPLEVELSEYDDDYLVVINSIKSKRHDEQSTGIGLQNIDNRYRLLGELPIKVVHGNEKFSVFLPKIVNQTK